MATAELRKAKLRVYVTVGEQHEVDGEGVTELTLDYQRVQDAGPLSGVWTIVRATAWRDPSRRLAMWTDGDAPQWVVDTAARFSPDQELGELTELGELGETR